MDARVSDGFAFFLPEEDSLEAWRAWFSRFGRQTAMGVHGIRLEAVDDNGLTVSMEIGDHARQPYGLLHGGITLLLAETAASMHACWGVDLTRRVPVGIEISASHLESARSGRVLAVAVQLRRSRRLTHHVVEVRTAEGDRLLSTVRMTNYYRPVAGE